MKNRIIEKNIQILRESGYSYGQITKILKVPKSTVALYCREYEANRDERKMSSQITLADKDKLHVCSECGELFVAKTKRAQEYCSGRCRVAAWRRKQKKAGGGPVSAAVSYEVLDFLGKTSDRYRGENSNQPLIIGVRKVET